MVEATERVAELWPHLSVWNDSFGTALSSYDRSDRTGRFEAHTWQPELTSIQYAAAP